MSTVVRLYRPSSGTEGEWFTSQWCDRCKRDKEYREGGWKTGTGGCDILARSFMHDIDEPGYPQEWVRDQDNKPKCLAFEDEGKPDRCTLTPDMFTGQAG